MSSSAKRARARAPKAQARAPRRRRAAARRSAGERLHEREAVDLQPEPLVDRLELRSPCRATRRCAGAPRRAGRATRMFSSARPALSASAYSRSAASSCRDRLSRFRRDDLTKLAARSASMSGYDREVLGRGADVGGRRRTPVGKSLQQRAARGFLVEQPGHVLAAPAPCRRSRRPHRRTAPTLTVSRSAGRGRDHEAGDRWRRAARSQALRAFPSHARPGRGRGARTPSARGRPSARRGGRFAPAANNAARALVVEQDPPFGVAHQHALGQLATSAPPGGCALPRAWRPPPPRALDIAAAARGARRPAG